MTTQNALNLAKELLPESTILSEEIEKTLAKEKQEKEIKTALDRLAANEFGSIEEIKKQGYSNETTDKVIRMYEITHYQPDEETTKRYEKANVLLFYLCNSTKINVNSIPEEMLKLKKIIWEFDLKLYASNYSWDEVLEVLRTESLAMLTEKDYIDAVSKCDDIALFVECIEIIMTIKESE